MATWEELAFYLEQHYSVRRTGDQLTLDLFYDQDQRSQQLFVEPMQRLGRCWVWVRTRVCHRDHLDPIAALERNANAPEGQLALDGDYYVLMSTRLADEIDAETLELTLNLLALSADELERAVEGDDRF